MTRETKYRKKLEKALPVLRAFVAADLVVGSLLAAVWFAQWWFSK